MSNNVVMKTVNFLVLQKMITSAHNVGQTNFIVEKLLVSTIHDNNSLILLELNDIYSDLGITLAILKSCLKKEIVSPDFLLPDMLIHCI